MCAHDREKINIVRLTVPEEIACENTNRCWQYPLRVGRGGTVVSGQAHDRPRTIITDRCVPKSLVIDRAPDSGGSRSGQKREEADFQGLAVEYNHKLNIYPNRGNRSHGSVPFVEILQRVLQSIIIGNTSTPLTATTCLVGFSTVRLLIVLGRSSLITYVYTSCQRLKNENRDQWNEPGLRILLWRRSLWINRVSKKKKKKK